MGREAGDIYKATRNKPSFLRPGRLYYFSHGLERPLAWGKRRQQRSLSTSPCLVLRDGYSTYPQYLLGGTLLFPKALMRELANTYRKPVEGAGGGGPMETVMSRQARAWDDEEYGRSALWGCCGKTNATFWCANDLPTRAPIPDYMWERQGTGRRWGGRKEEERETHTEREREIKVCTQVFYLQSPKRL